MYQIIQHIINYRLVLATAIQITAYFQAKLNHNFIISYITFLIKFDIKLEALKSQLSLVDS